MDLASFLRPEVWDRLCGHFKARRPGHEPAASDPSAPFDPVWSDENLESVLRLTALFGPTSFRVVIEGKPVRPAAYRDRAGWVRWDAVQQLRAARASINLTRVEDYSDLLLAFARALEAEMQAPVQINFYATPGKAQGLGAHADQHDVLVYQLQGRKTWQVAGLDDLTLGPGDWLFVPRGTRHEVRNLHPEPTAHLAIGIHPLTWGDFWQKAVDHANRTLPALAEALAAPATPAEGAHKLAATLLPALTAADPAAALRQYRLGFRNFAAPVPGAQVADAAALPRIGAATFLSWRLPDATVETAGEFLEVDLPYRRAPLALRPELAAPVRFMLGQPRFQPHNLPGTDATTALMLCRLLTGVGALRLAP